MELQELEAQSHYSRGSGIRGSVPLEVQELEVQSIRGSGIRGSVPLEV
jgi:hypothetical protein